MYCVSTLGPKVPVIDQQYSSTSNSITVNWAPGTSSQQVGSTEVHSAIALTDPGFFRGGCANSQTFFAENCMKMKEFGPPRGRGASVPRVPLVHYE